MFLKEVSSAHQGCIYLINTNKKKNLKNHVTLKTGVMISSQE